MKKLLLFLFVLSFASVDAQKAPTNKRAFRPDNPGTFKGTDANGDVGDIYPAVQTFIPSRLTPYQIGDLVSYNGLIFEAILQTNTAPDAPVVTPPGPAWKEKFASARTVQSASPPTDSSLLWLDLSSFTDNTSTERVRMEFVDGAWEIKDYYNVIGKVYTDLPAYNCRCDGQSNMAGTSESPILESADNMASDPRVIAWGKVTGKWSVGDVFTDPFDAPIAGATSNSPCFQFAKEMARKQNRTVRVIKEAFGGQDISFWGPTQARWIEGDAQTIASGIPLLDAFFWNQGESNDGTDKNTYKRLLYDLIDDLDARPYYDKNLTKFIATEITGPADGQNGVIRSLNYDTLGTTSYVKTKGLQIWDAGSHINSIASTELGKRYYQSVIDAESQIDWITLYEDILYPLHPRPNIPVSNASQWATEVVFSDTMRSEVLSLVIPGGTTKMSTVAWDGNWFWIAPTDNNIVRKYNPMTDELVDIYTLPNASANYRGATITGDTLYAFPASSGRMLKCNVYDNTCSVTTLPTTGANQFWGTASDGRYVVGSPQNADYIIKYDIFDGKFYEIPFVGANNKFTDITYAAGKFWFMKLSNNFFVSYDPKTDDIEQYNVNIVGAYRGAYYDGKYIYSVSNAPGSTDVARINPETGEVVRVDVGEGRGVSITSDGINAYITYSDKSYVTKWDFRDKYVDIPVPSVAIGNLAPMFVEGMSSAYSFPSTTGNNIIKYDLTEEHVKDGLRTERGLYVKGDVILADGAGFGGAEATNAADATTPTGLTTLQQITRGLFTAVTTDANGAATIPHTFGSIPTAVSANAEGPDFRHIQVTSKTATNFVIKAFNADGTPYVGALSVGSVLTFE